MNNFHQSVLLKEIIDFLQVEKGKRYIDATLGGGGHTAKILDLGGIVLGIDQDQEAIDFVSNKNEQRIQNKELILAKGNFSEIESLARLNNFEDVDGIFYDLGVSSYQIDTPGRGFSFLREGPLDMRMDKSSSLTAEVLVNLLGKGELNELFSKFGQESRSWVISNGIVRARRIKAIKTTSELVDIIAKAYGIRGEISDFTKNKISKKVFQALRIAVNSELEVLTESLPKSLELLGKKGRIAVITFHSLEDGIIKRSFEDFEKRKMGKILTKKPIEPSKEEVNKNSRASSAKLRVFEKN